MSQPARDLRLDEIDARQDEVLERLAELNASVERLLSMARSPAGTARTGRSPLRLAGEQAGEADRARHDDAGPPPGAQRRAA